MENERDGLWLRLVGRRGLAPQVGAEGEWLSVPMAPGQAQRRSLQEPEHRQIPWNGAGHKELNLPLCKQTEMPIESHQQCSRPAVT